MKPRKQAPTEATEAVKSDVAEMVEKDGKTFTVRPTQTVSIVCGDDVLFIGKGIAQITIK